MDMACVLAPVDLARPDPTRPGPARVSAVRFKPWTCVDGRVPMLCAWVAVADGKGTGSMDRRPRLYLEFRMRSRQAFALPR